MRVNNQTSDPVDWEQNGGSPPGENEMDPLCPQGGHLEVGEQSPDFEPCGEPPYRVTFITSTTAKPAKIAEANGILNPEAQVIVTSFPLVL